MARSFICGWELASSGESPAGTGTKTFQSTITHSPGYALQVNAPGTATYAAISSRAAGGTARSLFCSCRFYLYVVAVSASAPTTDNTIIWATAGAASWLRLNHDLTFSLNVSSLYASSTLSIDLGNWHRIEIDINSTSGQSALYVDGVAFIAPGSGPAAGSTAQTSMLFGQGCVSGESANFNLVIDDIIVDDTSFATSGLPGAGKQVLLIPTAGNNAGSWTDGAGGTGDIHAGVANIPPIGTAAATANIKIKNAASGTALDYVATMQTYLAGGIPPGSTINAVMALCNDGEEIATGTKSGGVWCSANPAQSAVTVGSGVGFDYGDDAGALGTYSANWFTHNGIVAAAPSVTLSSAPTVTVRKGSTTTRVVDVDFLGLYVDYTPPPISKLTNLPQSITRASLY